MQPVQKVSVSIDASHADFVKSTVSVEMVEALELDPRRCDADLRLIRYSGWWTRFRSFLGGFLGVFFSFFFLSVGSPAFFWFVSNEIRSSGIWFCGYLTIPLEVY